MLAPTSYVLFTFYSYSYVHHRYLHSFPTRRSSDLLVPRNGCGRPGRAPERFLPLDITSLLLHVIFKGKKRSRSEERFSRNAETDLVCRLLLEKKKSNEFCITNLMSCRCKFHSLP